MVKRKEYRTCDRCFKELSEGDHAEVCDGADLYFIDLCDACYNDYLSYRAEVDDINKKRREIAEKYKFGPYLPKEDKDETN